MAHAELVVPSHGGSLKRSASPCFHKEPKYIDEWLGAANDDYSVIRWRRAATAHRFAVAGVLGRTVPVDAGKVVNAGSAARCTSAPAPGGERRGLPRPHCMVISLAPPGAGGAA